MSGGSITPVPRPMPYARDMGQGHERWDTTWDKSGTSPTANARAPQFSAATAMASWDSAWDKSGTSGLSSCPKVLVPSVPLGQPARVPWSVQDWRAYYEERAGIRQHDAGLSRAAAERAAWLDTVALWLERHPVGPVAELVWDSALLRLARIAEAVAALAVLGIREPSHTSRP